MWVGIWRYLVLGERMLNACSVPHRLRNLFSCYCTSFKSQRPDLVKKCNIVGTTKVIFVSQSWVKVTSSPQQGALVTAQWSLALFIFTVGSHNLLAGLGELQGMNCLSALQRPCFVLPKHPWQCIGLWVWRGSDSCTPGVCSCSQAQLTGQGSCLRNTTEARFPLSATCSTEVLTDVFFCSVNYNIPAVINT